MCKRPGLSRNSLLLIMTGEKAKKRESGEGPRRRAGAVSYRALQAAVRILSLSSEKLGELE